MPDSDPGREWHIALHREVKKELRRAPRHMLGRIWEGIGTLALNPHPPGRKKLMGHEELYRIRIGSWRVVYQVDDATQTVTVLRVGRRGDVYRHL